MMLTAIIAGVLLAAKFRSRSQPLPTNQRRERLPQRNRRPTPRRMARSKSRCRRGLIQLSSRPSADANSETKAGYSDGGPMVPVPSINKPLVDPAVKPATATAPLSNSSTAAREYAAPPASDIAVDAATQAAAQAATNLLTQAITTPKDAALSRASFDIDGNSGPRRRRSLATDGRHAQLLAAVDGAGGLQLVHR